MKNFSWILSNTLFSPPLTRLFMLFRYVLSLDLIDPQFPTPRISPVPHYMLPLLLCGLLGFIPPTVSRYLSENSDHYTVVVGLVITKTGRYRPSLWIGWLLTTLGMGLLIYLH
ncbi:hypothetical protein BKA61DRAFT_589727 [Leptodontidium sp. MPI-SDFR-AT-0119]|nr:hypothetical protein BKA61DRAFT_589727 [Leptodontidium sp. MPI-SDFR-AT-0119]